MAKLVSGNKIVYRLFDKDGKQFAVAESSKSTINKCLEELQEDLKPFKIQTEKRSVTYRIKGNNMRTFETICLCEHCIEAIRSRGEDVFELEYNQSEDKHICEWCKEDFERSYDELIVCHF